MEFSTFYNPHIEIIRNIEFSRLGDQTYVDHAGTTLYAKSQLEAHHLDLMSHVYGNPHSRSASSRLTADIIEQIRYRILRFFNTSAEEYSVIFTAGCTAALKIVAETFNFNHNTNSCECIKGNNSKCQESSADVGCFYYLQDNHTSAQGIRELVAKRTKNIHCVDTCHLSSTFISNSEHSQESFNNLFVYPAQSNFSGQKFPLEWIEDIQNSRLKCQQNTNGRWFVLLDAAAFVSTSYMDLDKFKPDFVTLSFYKIFGFPTSLGALLVKNDSAFTLNKEYFGGGTVAVSSAQEPFHVFRENICERFEDGTLPFLDIIALRHGFDVIENLGGGIKSISQHTFSIAQYFYHVLKQLHHNSGKALAVVYGDSDFTDINTQGAIVNFNLKRGNGDYIGFAEVDKLAQLYNVHLRTGCFCNIGACQKYLGITLQQLQDNFKEGHVCGDDKDLINGQPTGSVRISFGYMSTLSDAKKCLQFIVDCFLEAPNPLLEISNLSIKVTECEKVLKTTSFREISPSKLTCTSDFTQHAAFTTNEVIRRCDEKNRLLTNIFVYPIKSCGAFEVIEWEINNRGLLYDREWMIVSDSGVTISQKREPRLCLIKPILDLQTKRLYLDFQDMPRLCLSLEYGKDSFTGEVSTNKVCGDRVKTFDCGEEAADWISLALGRSGCRLLRQNIESGRKCKLKDTASEKIADSDLSLANESQFLLINRQSVQALLKKIKEHRLENAEERKGEELLETDVEIDEESMIKRFRANLVVGGGICYEEDEWSDINIGTNQMISQGGCSRCQMICLDQTTATRSKEPLKSLAVWRGRKVPFGIHVRIKSLIKSITNKSIKVGDEIEA